MPLMHSAACCVIAPISVTGAVAPASGIDTISAGTPARARSIKFCDANPDQFSGGEGHTSNTARGFAFNASRPPQSTASRSIITCVVCALNEPVTIGLSEYHSTRNSR